MNFGVGIAEFPMMRARIDSVVKREEHHLALISYHFITQPDIRFLSNHGAQISDAIFCNMPS